MLVALTACSPKPVEPPPIRNPSGLPTDSYAPRGWTWSPIPGVTPVRRYGVGSPPRVPRAEVLILPEREPAEVWFPVANALIARGYNVWLADPQRPPLNPASAHTMIQQVIRGGASNRLLVLAQGRGAVSALMSMGTATRAVVLWSPVTGSPPVIVPPLEAWVARTLRLGRMPVFGQGGWREGDPAGDPLAQAWMKANPSLRPKAPLYASLDDYDYFLRDLPTHRKAAAPIWISGGDKAANDACVAIASACKRIAPGIEAAIAVFDEATKDVTLGAPPPPVGKKKRAPAT